MPGYFTQNGMILFFDSYGYVRVYLKVSSDYAPELIEFLQLESSGDQVTQVSKIQDYTIVEADYQFISYNHYNFTKIVTPQYSRYRKKLKKIYYSIILISIILLLLPYERIRYSYDHWFR